MIKYELSFSLQRHCLNYCNMFLSWNKWLTTLRMQTHAFHVCISYKHHARFWRPGKDFWLYPSNLLLFSLLIEKIFFASSMLCLVLSLCLISPLTIKVMDVWKSLATIRHCGQEQEEDREVRVWQDDTTDRDLRQALEEDLERADHHCCKTAKTASVYCRLAMLFKSLVFVTLLCSSS